MPDQKPLRQIWSENLDAALTAAGIKNNEVAFKLDVTEVTVARWRRGESAPHLDDIERLAELLGVPAGDLFPKAAA